MSDPRQKDFDERHTKLPTVTALTKREYFSVMALQGILIGTYEGTGTMPINEVAQKLASDSIVIADELLKKLS